MGLLNYHKISTDVKATAEMVAMRADAPEMLFFTWARTAAFASVTSATGLTAMLIEWRLLAPMQALNLAVALATAFCCVNLHAATEALCALAVIEHFLCSF